MPIDTPEATGRPLPPSACHNGCCCWRAKRSQAAISTAPLAMKWPRTRASAAKISRGCGKSTPRTSGAMNSLMTCHVVSVVSLL